MKRYIFSILATLAVVSLLAPGVLQAQNLYRLTGKIPFDFIAGTSALPAGEYTIEGRNDGILKIWNRDCTKSVTLLTTSGMPAPKENLLVGKVVFNKYGNEHFLTQVVNPNMEAVRNLSKSRQEKELIKQAANPSPLVVAMKAR